jgi:hypothetical protein
MLLFRQRSARSNVGMFLLLLLLLTLPLVLPSLNLVAAEFVTWLCVVCHDALFLNTTG